MTIRFLRAGVVLAALYPALTWAQCNVSYDADYRLEFNATWSATTLPPQFPPNPHFSGLVGGSHNAQVTFWEEGGFASNAIEGMAELGDQGLTTDEVNLAIGAGTALDNVFGVGFVSPGFTSTDFTVDQAHPLVTAVAMIAPSPDWFVGVNSLSLFSAGNWLEEVSVTLFGYDAGTDSGTTYTSDDADTQPPEPISALTGPLFMYNGVLVPFGTFRFVRLTESCLDTDGDGDPDPTDPDDDNDGILDCVDSQPLVFSNQCPDPISGFVANDASVETQVVMDFTCVANQSIRITGATQVFGTDGHIRTIAPVTGLLDGFKVFAGGSATILSASPDDPAICL